MAVAQPLSVPQPPTSVAKTDAAARTLTLQALVKLDDDALCQAVPSLLQILTTHALLSDYERCDPPPALYLEWIDRIEALLGSDHCLQIWSGVQLLCHVVESAPLVVVSQRSARWCRTLLRHITRETGDADSKLSGENHTKKKVVDAAYKGFIAVLDRSQQWPATRREVTVNWLPKYMGAMLSKRPQELCEYERRALFWRLERLLRLMGASMKPYIDPVTSLCMSNIDHPTRAVRTAAALTLSATRHCLPSNSWKEFVLGCTLHLLNLLRGRGGPETGTMFPPLPSSASMEPLQQASSLAHRFSAVATALSAALRLPKHQAAEVPLPGLVTLFEQVVCYDVPAPALTGLSAHEGPSALSLWGVLPHMQVAVCEVVKAALVSFGHQLLPLSSSLRSTMAEALARTARLPSCVHPAPGLRVEIYTLATHFMEHFGAGFAASMAATLVPHAVSDMSGPLSAHDNTSSHVSATASVELGSTGERRSRQAEKQLKAMAPPTTNSLRTISHRATSERLVGEAALRCLTTLLQTAGARLKTELRTPTEQSLVSLLLSVSSSASSVSSLALCPAPSGYRALLYSCLCAAVASAPAVRGMGPLLTVAVKLFRQGLQDISPDVRRACRSGLDVTMLAARPRGPPLAPPSQSAGTTPWSIRGLPTQIPAGARPVNTLVASDVSPMAITATEPLPEAPQPRYTEQSQSTQTQATFAAPLATPTTVTQQFPQPPPPPSATQPVVLPPSPPVAPRPQEPSHPAPASQRPTPTKRKTPANDDVSPTHPAHPNAAVTVTANDERVSKRAKVSALEPMPTTSPNQPVMLADSPSDADDVSLADVDPQEGEEQGNLWSL